MHIAHLLPVQRKKIHRKRLIFQSWRKENHAPNICLLFVKGDDLALKTKNKVNTEKGDFVPFSSRYGIRPLKRDHVANVPFSEIIH